MSSEWPRFRVAELQAARRILVEDGNHGEYRPRSEEFASSGVSFIRAADMADGRVLFDSAACINEVARARIRKGIGRPGDVLLSHKGTVGKVALVPERCPEYVCSPQTTFWRVLDETTVDRRYLFAYLQSQEFKDQLASRKGETDMADYVSLTAQRQLSVPLPRLEVQQAIGRHLTMLSDRIALLRETNATLEAVAQALFKSWFVDFDPVRAKSLGLAPAGMDEATVALFPDGFEESALGSIPASWSVAKLGEVTAYLNRGISPKYLDSGGIRVLNQKCVRDFAVDMSKARRHDAAQKSVAGRELKVGDVLVNSTDVGTLGRVAQILALDETTIVDSHVTVVRAGERVTWNFLGLAMMRRQAEIEGLGEGTTGQTELSRGKLATLPFVVPPEAMLRIFDAAILPLRMRLSANAQQAQTLATLRDTLLPRLTSGQLRLPDAEALPTAT